MRGYLGPLLAIVRKDIMLEFRTKDIVVSVSVFSILVIVIFNFAIAPTPQTVAVVAPGVLWVAFVFGGVLGLTRSFALEKDGGNLRGILLAPVSRDAIFFGKMLASFLFMMLVEVLAFPVFAVLFNFSLVEPILLPTAVLATLGITATGTVFSAMAVNTRAREDQGDADRFLIEHHFLVPFVRRTPVTMVTGKDHHRVVSQISGIECIKHARNMPIDHLNHLVISPNVLTPFLLGHATRMKCIGGLRLYIANQLRLTIGDGMVLRQRGQLIPGRRITHLPFRQRHLPRPFTDVMGIYEVAHRHEGLIMFSLQEFHQPVRRLFVTPRTQQLNAATVVFGGHVFSYPHALIPRPRQHIRQEMLTRKIVIPEEFPFVTSAIHLMRVLTRQHADARRTAKRIGTIGALKPHPSSRERIHGRRRHMRVARTTHRRGGLLVGDEPENVRSFTHVMKIMSQVRLPSLWE